MKQKYLWIHLNFSAVGTCFPVTVRWTTGKHTNGKGIFGTKYQRCQLLATLASDNAVPLPSANIVICWPTSFHIHRLIKLQFLFQVRCGMTSASSIETELQQRASILAVDNAGLRSQLESANAELISLRSRLVELESTRSKLVKVQQQALSLDKENKSMKQTLKYLQEELVKTGKKNLH